MAGHDRRKHDEDGKAEQKPGAFTRMAMAVSRLSGRPAVFAAAVALVVVWAASGPLLGFSEPWQLAINTSTTIITFLMVFLIQATQHRDSEAIHLKLDELIEATSAAREEMIDLEDQPDEVIEQRREEMKQLRNGAASRAAGDTT